MVKDSIECYGEVSDAFLQCSESVSTKVIWQENIEEEKSTLEYFEILSGDSKDNGDIDSSKIEEMLGDIKERVDLGRKDYLEIGEYLESKVNHLVVQAKENFQVVAEELKKHCLGLLLVLCSFPDKYRELKKKLKADNSNPEFVNTFQSSFGAKSILIIDHLFYFFELFQKTLRETIIENLQIWGKEYETVMKNSTHKFDEQVKQLFNAMKKLAKVKSQSSLTTDLKLAERSTITEIIESVQIEMSKTVLMVVSETSKSVKFSFEFLENLELSFSGIRCAEHSL